MFKCLNVSSLFLLYSFFIPLFLPLFFYLVFSITNWGLDMDRNDYGCEPLENEMIEPHEVGQHGLNGQIEAEQVGEMMAPPVRQPGGDEGRNQERGRPPQRPRGRPPRRHGWRSFIKTSLSIVVAAYRGNYEDLGRQFIGNDQIEFVQRHGCLVPTNVGRKVGVFIRDARCIENIWRTFGGDENNSPQLTFRGPGFRDSRPLLIRHQYERPDTVFIQNIGYIQCVARSIFVDFRAMHFIRDYLLWREDVIEDIIQQNLTEQDLFGHQYGMNCYRNVCVSIPHCVQIMPLRFMGDESNPI